MRFEINVKKDIEMAEIMGTVTSIKRYLSPEKIELKISPDMGAENTITLPQNRKYIIPDFQREIRWEENNLSILLSDLSSGPRFLGNIILTIERNGDCQIIDGQQRTTILLLIIAYIRSRYQEELEPFTPCSIENRSFIGLSKLLGNGFEDSLLKDPEIIKTDYYGQRQSFVDLWRWLEKEESFATAHAARTILENIEKSRVNIIASHEDESNSSIRYFLDVNLKGVQLDIEDIFKAQIFSLSLSNEMLQLWRENKTAMLIFNQTKIKGEPEKQSKERYPLMKVYEHFFYCDLFKSKPELEQQKLKFGEDFSISTNLQYEGKKFFKGSHLIEVLGDIRYVKQSLRRLKRAIEVMNDIVSTSGPSEKFKSLFKCQQRIDSNQVTLVYDFFQRILLDKEIVPKILVLKYILEFYDGEEHQKREYDSAYSIFAAASLFILFAAKKDGEKFYKIAQAEDWIDKLNEWIKAFISGVELTKGRMMAVYRFTEGEEETSNMFQSVRCKALAMLHNYFVFKTNAGGEKYVSIKNGTELLSYLTNKDAYTLEHFVIPKGKTIHIQTDQIDFQYNFPRKFGKYRDFLFDYIFIPKNLNGNIEQLSFVTKVKKLDEHQDEIYCDYSLCYLSILKESRLFTEFPRLEQISSTEEAKECLDRYFEEKFTEDFYDFAKTLISEIDLIPCL